MLGYAPSVVGLVTIWYRAGQYIDRFVGDLRALEQVQVQPVFVINDMTAEEVARLRTNVPTARILEPGRNVGTAAGWNLAIQVLLDRAITYVGIWNVDVTLHGRSLERLLRVMEDHPKVGACQPILFYSDDPGRIEMYGGSVDLRNGRITHDFEGATSVALLPSMRDAQYLDGGTMLLRADALREVGGFDDKLFLYAEDTDLSVRFQRAGYRTVAVRDAWAWHYHRENKGTAPMAHQVFYETRNRLYLTRKHAGHCAFLRLAARTVPSLPRGIVRYLRRGRPRLACAYLAGFVFGVAGLMGNRGWVD